MAGNGPLHEKDQQRTDQHPGAAWAANAQKTIGCGRHKEQQQGKKRGLARRHHMLKDPRHKRAGSATFGDDAGRKNREENRQQGPG